MVFYYLIFLSAQLIPGELMLLPSPKPCKKHMVVKTSPERSVSHMNNHPTLCDKDLDGWYRFEQGEIATSCVPVDHCNKNTIWMDDTFPTVSDGIQTKKFCGRVAFLGQQAKSCCEYEFTVRVANCGEFMTYEFINTHLSGALVPCPIAYCTDTIPKITSINLAGPQRSEDGFEFNCTFNYELTNETDGIYFEVQWLFDNKPVANEVVTAASGIRSVTSNQSLWMNHFGESIEPQSIHLTEGNETEVTITSTLPILCNDFESKSCSLVLGIDHNTKEEELTTNTCSLTLTTSPQDVTSTQTLRLRLNPDILLHPDNQYNLSLQIQAKDELENFWQGRVVNFPVTTVNFPQLDCTVFPECHVFGFNKTRISTIEYPGDFLLYNSTNDTDNQLEVHIRQMIIEGETPTTCGVAMRYGDEIVFLDICTYKTVPVITRNSQEARLTVSECDGNLYLISASNGAWLHVEVYKSKLAILLHGPLQTSARNNDLCSLETATSSLTKQEMLLFRLDRSTSLFRERGSTTVVVKHGAALANCHCSSGSETCEQMITNPLTMKKCNHINIQEFGSTLNSEIAENYEVRYWPWPTKSGHLKNKSRTGCHIAISNSAPQICVKALSKNLDLFYNACLENIKKTDSTDGHVGIVQAFMWFCQTTALLNSIQSHPANTTSVITSEICPHFCNFNGECNKGVCHCHAGYSSEDCSVKQGTEPVIVGILGGETCALSTGRCFHPTFIVDSSLLASQEHLTLHLIPFTINKTMETLVHGAQYISLNKMDYDYASSIDISSYKMEDKTAYGYRMFFLGSDGLTSTRVDYVIYDDKCRKCFSTKLIDGVLCTLKENSCHIDDQCYMENEVKQFNKSLECNPYESLLHWSPVKGLRRGN